MAEFEIKVTELEAGGKHYLFPLRASWLEGELRALGSAGEGLSAPEEDGEVDVYADKTGADVIVRGHLRGGVVTECSRCLGPALVDVDTDLAVLLTARGRDLRDVADSDDISPDEMDREFFTGDVIDLGPLVREQLMLEIPMQPLCRPDCPGIAGTEAQAKQKARWDESKPAIDPRLAPLLSISLGKDTEAKDEAPAATKHKKKSSRRSR